MSKQLAKNSTALSTTTAFWIRSLSLSALILSSFASPALSIVKGAEIVSRPRVEGDRVTLRVKVNGEGNRPLAGLQDSKFHIFVDAGDDYKEVHFRPQDWKNPTEAVPPSVRIILLLDYSRSMDNKDQKGAKKLAGAVAAIRAFVNNLKQRAVPAQVAIVPFGSDPDLKNCTSAERSYPVKQPGDVNHFYEPEDVKQETLLNFLENGTPCAATNIYEPLTTAINFFAQNFPAPDPNNQNQPEQPRLAIVLLSDGYHSVENSAEDEKARFVDLESLIKRYDHITVNTVGYGLTWKELGEKYRLGRPATPEDLNRFSNNEEFQADYVAWDRLKQIADDSGGIFDSSGDAQKTAAALQLVLAGILGEYEITYTDPHPVRGAKHLVQVQVDSGGNSVTSPSSSYVTTIFGLSVPWSVRLPIIALTLALIAGGGVLPFWYWAKTLKQQT